MISKITAPPPPPPSIFYLPRRSGVSGRPECQPDASDSQFRRPAFFTHELAPEPPYVSLCRGTYLPKFGVSTPPPPPPPPPLPPGTNHTILVLGDCSRSYYADMQSKWDDCCSGTCAAWPGNIMAGILKG